MQYEKPTLTFVNENGNFETFEENIRLRTKGSGLSFTYTFTLWGIGQDWSYVTIEGHNYTQTQSTLLFRGDSDAAISVWEKLMRLERNPILDLRELLEASGLECYLEKVPPCLRYLQGWDVYGCKKNGALPLVLEVKDSYYALFSEHAVVVKPLSMEPSPILSYEEHPKYSLPKFLEFALLQERSQK